MKAFLLHNIIHITFYLKKTQKISKEEEVIHNLIKNN